ncbi:PKD domain-containing protein [Phaeocystidibacter marisrubri]|uniref:PKD domain-containing protein n=1 Tax=Phaeocystidibacter marisrubri TaxID=1577780 RepID=A0A6L3ZCT5_9FLAO|nr:PKD domain-containing protein [Phaeocystidibacter marisrubri]KAB2815665.1 PKD domain-containing protein [Phaeocystidibacter marisrubri]
MKQRIGALITLTFVAISTILWWNSPTDPKSKYREIIANHPFAQRKAMTVEELNSIPKKDRPDLAWEQNFLATIDPALGRPAPERLSVVYQTIAAQYNSNKVTPGFATTPWEERGPNNVGGRTRAIMYDPNDPTHKKVWAGGTSGGLWYNNDITDPTSTWIAVNDFWANLSVTAIAHDPTNSNIWYVGTGEGWGTGATRGAGVWKSTDGGSTWNQLSATTSWYYVNDLIVRNESGTGVLYVACRDNFYSGAWHGNGQGLQRSINGGTSFSQVLPNVSGQSYNYAPADLELASNGRIWVGTQSASYGGGGGRILYSDNGTSWTTAYSSSGTGRVELACAPSNASFVYAVVESGGQVHEMVNTINAGSTWNAMNEPSDADPGIPASDFSRGQAWYDLILAVHPTNPNMVYVGAIDCFRSSNGGSTWTQLSHWYGGYGFPNVHADQHQMIFNPGNSNEMLLGNDGGIYRMTGTAGTTSVSSRNNGYNVTQFYSCAIHPNANNVQALAGSQDNGTQRFTSPGVGATNEATGGDGAFCFIDQTNPNLWISSYVYNTYYRSINGGTSFLSTEILNDPNTGRFINPADYDDNLGILYSARTNSTLSRVSNVAGSPTASSIAISGMSDMASHIRVSPYTTTSTTLFVGTGSGDLYKVTQANGSPSSTSIGSALPAGYISCVEVGASENELIVTYSNYGMTSVWYTNNGGASWVSKEGSLPDMPVRWALFNPHNRNEVLLATEVGVWTTSNFNSTYPSWSPSNQGLANVRVDMLQMRSSDDEVIAATYGRGLFTSNGFAPPAMPVANFGAVKTVACTNEAIQLVDSSTGVPTSYSWSISPNTYSYINGTGASSHQPEVHFSAAGQYTITLTVSNGSGTDTKTRNQFIQVGGYSLPFTEDFQSSISDWTLDNPDGSHTWKVVTAHNGSSSNKAAVVENYFYNGVGQRDGLISPPLNFSSYASVSLDFEYAYRRYGVGYEDSLAVYVSTDCGTTWTRVASYKETGSGGFVTGPNNTNAFVPTGASEWCGASPACPTLDISAFAGHSDVLVKFENICGYGNNLYIDNINIQGVSASPPSSAFHVSATSVCPSEVLSLTDNSTGGPTSWSWSFSPPTGVSYVNGTNANSQSPQVSFSTPGTYSINLTTTNSYGSNASSQVIQVDSLVVSTVSVNAMSTNVCFDEQVAFVAGGSNLGTHPQYLWYLNGILQPSTSVSWIHSSWSVGDYVQCKVIPDVDCPAADTVSSSIINMTVDPGLNPIISISSADTVCGATATLVTMNYSNAGPSPTIEWFVDGVQIAQTGASVYISRQVDYTLYGVLTTDEPCEKSDTTPLKTIYVDTAYSPSVSLVSSPSSVCAGDSVFFTATGLGAGPGAYYQWEVNGIVQSGVTGNTFFIPALQGGEYVLVRYFTTQNCSFSNFDSDVIQIPAGSGPPSVAIQLDSSSVGSYCDGQNFVFTATVSNVSPYENVTWMKNGVVVGTAHHGVSQTFNGLNNGDQISATITSTLPCVLNRIDTSDVLVMNLAPLPVVTLTGSISRMNLCEEDTVDLTFSPSGGTLTGQGLVGNQFIPTIAGNGVKWVRYAYADPSTGCSTYQVLNFNVTLVPKPTVNYINGKLVTPLNGYDYQWYDGNGVIIGATNSSYTPTQNGVYRLEVSKDSCSKMSDELIVDDISVPEWKGIEALLLYPNPTQRMLTLYSNSTVTDEVVLTISDAKGAVLTTRSTTIEIGENRVEFDLLNWPPGVYTLQIQGRTGVAVRTFEVAQ